MRAFGSWLGLVAVEIALCLVLSLAVEAAGYPAVASAFVRCAVVIAGIGVASCVALVLFMVWIQVRVRAGAGLSGVPRLRAGQPPASPHGPK